jgi:hypothetical protein
MSNVPDRSKLRKQVRPTPRKPWNPDEEIARLHAHWVATGGKEGSPDDDKINLPMGARDAKGNVRPEAIKNLRNDVSHEYNANDWK